MIIKKHVSEGRLILAACDSSIIGKTFEEGDAFLDLSASFYKGAEISKQEFISIIKKAYIINAAGKEVIEVLVEQKLISEKDPKIIQGVPHIQLFFSNK